VVTAPDDPINIRTTAIPGEAKQRAVVSPDGRIVGFAQAVPFPVEASDKSCKPSVVQYSPLDDVVAAVRQDLLHRKSRK
jgi:hypothetical protein